MNVVQKNAALVRDKLVVPDHCNQVQLFILLYDNKLLNDLKKFSDVACKDLLVKEYRKIRQEYFDRLENPAFIKEIEELNKQKIAEREVAGIPFHTEGENDFATIHHTIDIN